MIPLGCYIYTRTERRGNRQVARETERESVRVWERCVKTDLASVVKLTVGKTQLTSFWDKLGWINILMEGLKRDTRKIKYFLMKTLETVHAMTCRTFSILYMKCCLY